MGSSDAVGRHGIPRDRPWDVVASRGTRHEMPWDIPLDIMRFVAVCPAAPK